MEVYDLANIKSAKKRILVNQTKADRNKAIKSGVKTAIKKVYAAIESGDKDKLFPIKASQKAHDSIKRVYSLMNAESKLHIDVFPGKHAVCGRKSFDWLAK